MKAVRGMRAGGAGIPGRWVGPDSDGSRLTLFVGQSVTVVLPKDPGSGVAREPTETVSGSPPDPGSSTSSR